MFSKIIPINRLRNLPVFYYAASDHGGRRYDNLMIDNAYSLKHAAGIADTECVRKGMTLINVRTFSV
jgi:hypothetical protein